MLKFTEKVVGTVQVPLEVTEEMIESVVVGAFEGGSNYWMGLYNEGEDWDECPKNEPWSTWATKLILEGKTIYLYDREEGEYEDEDGEKHTLIPLNLEKLLKGIELNATHRKWDSSIKNGDATIDDCIIQYAVFGELVYG